MSSSQIAIKVDGLSKRYEIYKTPGARLKQFIFPRLFKLFGLTEKKYFNEFWALKDVSFEIKKGETIGIIGRNGSGKSTLLQLICGTLTPTSGRVETKGRIAALLELGSGFNPEFTGRENVYMNASVLGLTKKEIDQRFNEIVSFADIGGFIEQPVKTYSSGMMLRLAFAVIAHVDADILIIDEALAVGDAFFTQKCMRFLRKFMVNGTIMFVSHDTAAVINFCHEAIWLDKGVTKTQGSPKIVAQKYLAEFYESFQGESMQNFVKLGTDSQKSNVARLRDMRADFINNTQFRNDIEIISFNENVETFGKGGAEVVSVAICDEADQKISWIVGGEDLKVRIKCKANKDMLSPIVGFHLNDKLGQPLFGDNTFNFSKAAPLIVKINQIFRAEFYFKMPILPVGDYTLSVAIAEGTQANHIQHQWVNDIISIKSHSSSLSTGLIGISMHKIIFDIEGNL